MDDNERLIRLETKIDGLQTTLDVRLTHIEAGLSHEMANREAADHALRVEIEKRATRLEVEAVEEIAKANRSTIARVAWTVILAVLGGLLSLVVGGQAS